MYGVYIDDHGHARDVDGYIIHVSKDDIRNLLERASMDEHSYICLPEHERSFTQIKLVPEIYTKYEINEILYGICGAQEKNEDNFQMKLDGVHYPLNDSISWLTTCMGGDEARHSQNADTACGRSNYTIIDRHKHLDIDRSTMTHHNQIR